jgi:hypothetical protein
MMTCCSIHGTRSLNICMYVVVHYTITQILGDVEISEFLQELVAETSFKNILTGMKVSTICSCIKPLTSSSLLRHALTV